MSETPAPLTHRQKLAFDLGEDLAAVAWPILMEHCVVNCCIAATAAALDVCRHYKRKAFARPCRVIALNPPMVAHLETHEYPETWEEAQRLHEATGAWSVAIGFGTSFAAGLDQPFGWVTDQEGSRYNGHVVAVVEDRILLDLSIPQVSRPERGMEFTCCVAVVPPEFGQGRRSLSLQSAGCVVQYKPEPDRNYRRSRSWSDAGERAPIVRAMLAAVRERIMK